MSAGHGHARTATTFNPLTAARGLEAAGIERRQAEAIAEGPYYSLHVPKPNAAPRAVQGRTPVDLDGTKAGPGTKPPGHVAGAKASAAVTCTRLRIPHT